MYEFETSISEQEGSLRYHWYVKIIARYKDVSHEFVIVIDRSRSDTMTKFMAESVIARRLNEEYGYGAEIVQDVVNHYV